MNSQAGNNRNGFFQVDQLMIDGTVFIQITNTTGQRQVTIKPRIEQRAAVHFHAQLQIIIVDDFGIGLYFQTRAVGVRTDHTHAIFDQRLVQLKRDNR